MKTKVAIVTGGSSGIGRCTAIALQQLGCTVYEFSRRENPIDGVDHIGVDVTDESSITVAIDQITAKNGRVDILVNCAGNGISGAVEFTELKDAKAQFEVNFFGMVNMNKSVLPVMRQQGFGRIVNISSVAAVVFDDRREYNQACKKLFVRNTESNGISSTAPKYDMVLVAGDWAELDEEKYAVYAVKPVEPFYGAQISGFSSKNQIYALQEYKKTKKQRS